MKNKNFFQHLDLFVRLSAQIGVNLKKIKEWLGEISLSIKIRLYFAVIILQFCLVFFMLFTNMVRYTKEYNQIVQSATIASGFSIDFKKDFDYKMYRIIIGSEVFTDASPHEDMKAAQAVATKLLNAARTTGNRDRAEGIQKYLNNLKKHVVKIEENLIETGHYDENISILENDIRVLTSLIQDTVLEYIYYDTMEMETVRQEMGNQTMETVEISIIMIIIMVLGAFVFSVIISGSISKPIRLLSNITKQVAKGDLSVRSDIKSGAEVKILSESLNIMIEKLSNLIETVKVEQNNLRDAELKLLQAQINPHFLYNTLDAIMWLAEADKKQEVIAMVGSLSDYFRTSLSKGNDLITLEEELQHIKSYLEIQQFRYKDILDYNIYIPPELNHYRIPKITLQPLVENALYHGIKNKRGKGNINIGGKIAEENIILFVRDNGMGMKSERVRQIMCDLKEKADRQDTQFYGLFNVNERLQLYYGKNYGLNITSIYTEGTTVEVYIPYC